MQYKANQVIKQSNEEYGKAYSYQFEHMPKHMNPMHRHVAGVVVQPAVCKNLMDHKVMVRGPQYTIAERSDGKEGIKRGRDRFLRCVNLLNQVQGETVAFPEPLDLIFVHNRDDIGLDDELARQEPRLVFERLQGDSLERFGYRKSKLALYQEDHSYWFDRKLTKITDQNRFKGIQTYRVVRLLRNIAIHCQGLLNQKVVHLDINPSHIHIMHKDEIPRLLGIGHLAPLDRKGHLHPDDPIHAFTTAGYAAPELVNESNWEQPLDGEAIMLYSLGAVCLSILFTGPKADLSKLWRQQGGAAIEALLREIQTQKDKVHPKTAEFFTLIEKLLITDPRQRKSAINMKQLIKTLHDFIYDVAKSEEMTCKHCTCKFKGFPKRSVFKYQKHSFTLCPEHYQEALQLIEYKAKRCGHMIEERQGLLWARKWVGYQPKANCNDCRS